MTTGKKIRRLRQKHGYTQETLAELLHVSFQAVSCWERDEYRPELDKLLKLADLFGVSLSSLVDENQESFECKDAIYNWEHMKTRIKASAAALHLADTLKAVDFAQEAHRGQKRKNSDVPYIYHPFTMTCHALALGIHDDALLSSILLHDVIEDCPKSVNDLPVSQEARDIVILLTHPDTDDSCRASVMDRYYDQIAQNQKAALIKCIDRCNNLTTMSWGLSRKRMIRMISETETYYPRLLKVLKSTSEYSNAAWLLQYQIESMLDIYKRML